MGRFTNTNVGTKLLFGFSVMILLLIVVGYVGYWSAGQINAQMDRIFGVNLQSTTLLLEADRDLHQLLVAERSMIFANTDSDVFKKLLAEYETNLRQADERWEKFKAIASTAEEKELISQYEKDRASWKSISRRIVDARLADTREGRREALDLSLGNAKQAFEQARVNLDKLTELSLKYAEQAESSADALYRNAIVGLWVSIGLGLMVGVLLAWRIGRGITRRLRNVIEGLSIASNQVVTASNQVASSSQQLAEGASEQAAAIEETSSSLEEMSSMTRQNADNAGQANTLMTQTSQVVREAAESMEALTGAIQDISSASEQTQKIIKTIDEIAFQTNLLALNAAVEAARAGEAGAGFAVVADEVRNLAMRAAEAAKNTATLIEGTVSSIKRGADLVDTTSSAFSKVSEGASKVAELIGEISAASSEQAQGIEQVNRAVSEMDKVTQRNAASAEESAAAAGELSGQSSLLESYVEELSGMVAKKAGPSSTARKTPTGLAMAHHLRAMPTPGEDPGKARKRLAIPYMGGNHGMKSGRRSAEHSGESVARRPDEAIPFDEDLQNF